jgi:hypothetical protein
MATVALLAFATLFIGKYLLDKTDLPYALTMASLLLIAGGSWVMGTEKVHSNTYLDSALAGYAMISVGTAQISVVSF